VRPSPVQHGESLLRIAADPAGGANDHIAVAIAVHVAGTGNAVGEERAGAISFRRPTRSHLQTIVSAEEEISPPLILPAVVILVGANHHIAVTVAVHVT